MYLLHGLAADPSGILHASQRVLLSSANYICSYQQPHIGALLQKVSALLVACWHALLGKDLYGPAAIAAR